MKKKFLATALATAMVFAMAGCASNDVVADVDAITNNDEVSDDTANTDDTATVDDDQQIDDTAAEKTDLDYIKEKGTLVVGITDFEPMDYKDEAGNWIGFDAELAEAFGAAIGVKVEFVEIDWDNKIMELNGKTVDCIWNGMTLTEEVKSAMECSNAYCVNAQVVIVNASVADQYQTTESLTDLAFAVEAGSAGEEQAVEYGLTYTAVESQANALMEVKAGTSDAAIIDNLMAAAMVGEGTSYADLTYTVALNSEEYGVGFRKGSNVAAELNAFFEACLADGTMMELADKYGVSAMIMQ
ncbi:MAG: transporter substrate-binding domain-containing protein [Lachnospiraceae bacterium]|nr:transporter substrate-binding domain-containing protein [Lachnospiraceae bacterium]